MGTWRSIASLPPRWIHFQKTSNNQITRILVNTTLYPKVCIYNPNNKYIYSHIEFIPACNNIHPIEFFYENNTEAIEQFESISYQLSRAYLFNQSSTSDLASHLLCENSQKIS